MPHLFSHPRKEKEKLIYFHLYFFVCCHLVAKKKINVYLMVNTHLLHYILEYTICICLCTQENYILFTWVAICVLANLYLLSGEPI